MVSKNQNVDFLENVWPRFCLNLCHLWRLYSYITKSNMVTIIMVMHLNYQGSQKRNVSFLGQSSKSTEVSEEHVTSNFGVEE
jgi:hypothetical protein